MNDLYSRLNSATKAERLTALQELVQTAPQAAPAPRGKGLVNNHIHTTYSFSPYSPTSAVWQAKAAGLATAGIVDHDSVGGAVEFIEAGSIAGLPVTCGFEVRVSMANSPFSGDSINNTDQRGIAYVTCHGIPHNKFAAAERFLAPLRAARNRRNQQMVHNLNEILAPAEINLDFMRDVFPLSSAADGGSITERHLLYAVSLAIVRRFGKDGSCLKFLRDRLNLPASAKVEAQLSDPANPCYEYDLLAFLKGWLVEQFYVPATDELPDAAEFVRFCSEIGAVSAYAYLGDVGDSVTGDKKTQKYEDDYIVELFNYLKETGFNAVTYMPSRNTPEQLRRVMQLCEAGNFLQICGEDINNPRQKFICPQLAQPEFAHLETATWALICHEIAATSDPAASLFGARAAAAFPKVAERAENYARLEASQL